MSNNTRQTAARESTQTPSPRGPPPGATEVPSHIQNGTTQVYEVFAPGPPPSANALPDGYGQNTAGALPQQVTLSKAVETLRWQDMFQIHHYPCARDGLLTGIGGGFAAGGLRFVLGAPLTKACNWAVGTFVFATLGAYEFCQQKKRLEKANMKRAVEIIDRKKVEKEAAAQAKRDARRKAKEEADRLEEEKARGKSSWKLW